MRLISILIVMIAMTFAACLDSEGTPDGDCVDGKCDSPNGSGSSAARAGIEPSPKDYNLELGVIVIGVVVAVAPMGRRRKASV